MRESLEVPTFDTPVAMRTPNLHFDETLLGLFVSMTVVTLFFKVRRAMATNCRLSFSMKDDVLTNSFLSLPQVSDSSVCIADSNINLTIVDLRNETIVDHVG